MGRLQDKVTIVTGAARGQGEATARLFAAEGARVVLTDVLKHEGEQVARSIGESAIFLEHDVSDEAAWAAVVESTLERFGQVDVLVNNAAVCLFAPLMNTGKADFDRMLSINLLGCFLGMKAVVPAMQAAGRGSIVNISSVNGLRGTIGMSAYDAGKWAVRGMSKGVALELAPLGIRVNTVHPGAIDTQMLNPGDALDTSKMAKVFGIAFGRVGRAEEVAHASLFLASDDASYISGAELAVDGTWSAGLLTNITDM
ncbi:glucose 1-dehydrogenase [Trinickia violacea]|uniref:Glucose 1-dehydrogenase n=1 Tax=Trinickia violacea TaxID=2571746 RepID=A0A4P8IMX7_9BURK|nr:glucose 1-dehydrogenase [Trinickia violacea]QCP50348.1 glucose 1-dehydrogenase [Trinickia violacea]